MAGVKIQFKEFIDCYKDSLGLEGAEQLMKQTLYRANLMQQQEYSKEDALKICCELKRHSGFIGIIGGILTSRIIIR